MGQALATPTEANSYCGCAERNPVVTFTLTIGNTLLTWGEKPARSEDHPSVEERVPQLHLQRLGRLLAEVRMRAKVKLQLGGDVNPSYRRDARVRYSPIGTFQQTEPRTRNV